MEDNILMNNLIIQLVKDVMWVRSLWDMHEELYCSSEERFNRIHESFGFISNMMRHSVIVEMQLSICRISDKAETGRGQKAIQNATLYQLAKIAENSGLPEESKLIFGSAEKLDEASENIKSNRNKLLAHSDLENLKKSKSNSSHDIDLNEIENCIKIIEDCLSEINSDAAHNIIKGRVERKNHIMSEIRNIDKFLSTE